MAPLFFGGVVVVASLRAAAADWGEAMDAAARLGRPPPLLAPELPSDLAPSHGLQRPTVPSQWSSDLGYDGNFAGQRLENGNGTFYYDGEGRRYRSSYTTECRYFRPHAEIKQDQLTMALPNGNSSSNLTWGDGDDTTCLSWFGSGTKYNDLFAFLRFAIPAGTEVIHGEVCNVWSLDVAAQGVSLSACIAEDGYPRVLNQTFILASKWSGFTRMRFSNIRPGKPGEEVFMVSRACATSYPMPPCRDVRVAAIDVYRLFGPPEPLELDNRNGGDVLGDLAFVCTQGSGDAYRNKLITYWRVNVSYSFGQYMFCNFDGKDNRCPGDPAQKRTVGRRSGQMQGVGPHLGQCSPNADVGSQYSFPAEGKCPAGVSPGTGVCAWGGAVAVRTVAARCLIEERGLLDACHKEIGHAPFTHSAAIWQRAFASDDPARGGCPDAPADEVVLV